MLVPYGGGGQYEKAVASSSKKIARWRSKGEAPYPNSIKGEP